MTTNVTPDQFLAALTKWGVQWRFYKDRADWLSHNRNGAGNNQVTPGGFGPLRGVAVHNTAGANTSLAYLYNGDSARALPGPLCNWAVEKAGTVVLMGWGTSNATGPGDPVPDSLVRKNAMPLDREIVPTVGAITDPKAILYAPYYLGFESIYGSEGPTAAQRDAMVRTTCAALDALGGPANGYGAGSVVMHRELTTQRSDPQGWTRDGSFRRAVEALFKAGPPTAPTSEEDPLMALTVKNPLTGAEWPADDALWSIWTYSIQAARDATAALAVVKALAAKGEPLTAAETEAAVEAAMKDAVVNVTVGFPPPPAAPPATPPSP